MENLYIIVMLVLLGYVAFYLSGRKYLETFNDSATANIYRESPVHGEKGPNKAYPMTSMNTITNSSATPDNYELSAIFNNQGSSEVSKEEINAAKARYPLDWSIQGPGSQRFQEEKVKYEKNASKQLKPEPYQDTATDMLLPDASLLEDEERKLLQMYKPESSKGLLHYSMHDVTRLLDKLYAKRGLIPVIKKSNQGPNVWEIVEVKEKNPKIVWEDDVQPQQQPRDMMISRGENVIDVPYTASDADIGLDPFMRSKERARIDRIERNLIDDNIQLSRMFEPTYPIPDWN
jgi:hypothetical protein